MDFLWILVAFLCGFLMRQFGMPPLVGYLMAGFGLHALDVKPADSLETLAELGILLMPFTIGLKLNIKELVKVEVWGGAVLHSSVWVALLCAIFLLLGWLGLSHFFDISFTASLLIAFALSFSSTVCVVKMLEEASELKTRHGKLAIGILVIQDIVAVVFLVFSTGKVPSPWAIALIGLWFAKPFMHRLLSQAGHGELLPLIGFFFALGGAELFSLVNVKGDLGALVVGMMLASHKKAAELYKALMGFKDLFLIGFFLSIGFTALPTFEMLPAALLITLLLLAKFGLFFFILTRLYVSGRASFLSALSLMNFSEFGLIVAHISVKNGWLSQDWLVVIALVMSISFISGSYIYRRAHQIYASYKRRINQFEKEGTHARFSRPSGAEILIVGMGRVGKGAYIALEPELGKKVWGIESDEQKVKKLKEQGFDVVLGDADDFELWQRICRQDIKLVMLALPSQIEMISALDLLQMAGYQGRIAAVARYDDDRRALLAKGADVVFNYYAEVGAGFAAESRHLVSVDETPMSENLAKV